MMWGYGNYNSMMNWGGFGYLSLLWLITWFIFLVDLVLLGMWLWKQINKK